ncbi:MAG: MCE family protein [Planctomycetota bacterium]|nr:MAG: MCE family protein [Planctomycetota bacterium]
MGTKPNYLKIGIFVIVSVILLLVALVIWGSGILAEEPVYFETYFDSSVTGLNVGAPVENRGVRIGRVERITFVRNEYELPTDDGIISKYDPYVMVIASAEAADLAAVTPHERKIRLKQLISRGLRLRLASNLLTGQAYLEGDYFDPNRFPVLDIGWEPKHLYIPSAPGGFDTIKDSIDSILFKLEKIDTQKIGLEIERILVTMQEAISDANIPAIAAKLQDTLDRVDKLIASGRPDVEQSLENLRDISANLKDLTESLKRHPSEAIFSQPPPKSEAFK